MINFGKPKTIIFSFLIGIGAILFFHYIFNMTWKNEGSYDILFDAFLELFIFQVILQYWIQKNNNTTQKHLKEHLDLIEKLIKDQSRS